MKKVLLGSIIAASCFVAASSLLSTNVTKADGFNPTKYELAGAPRYDFKAAGQFVNLSDDGKTVTIHKLTTGTNLYEPLSVPEGVDVLYGHQYAPYEIQLPTTIRKDDIKSAKLNVSAVLDDHYKKLPYDYKFYVLANSVTLYDESASSLQHATSSSKNIENFKTISMDMTNLIKGNNQIRIFNTSTALDDDRILSGEADWIAVRSIEIVIELK